MLLLEFDVCVLMLLVLCGGGFGGLHFTGVVGVFVGDWWVWLHLRYGCMWCVMVCCLFGLVVNLICRVLR